MIRSYGWVALALSISSPALADDCEYQAKAPFGTVDRQREQAIKDFACEDLSTDTKGIHGLGTWTDRVGKDTSAIARAAWVWECLPGNRGGDADTSDLKWQQYGDCSVDARKLDRKAIDAELAALKLSPATAKHVVENFEKVKALADDWQKRTDKVRAEDATAGKLLLDVPAAAFADWQKLYQANQALFEAGYAVEDKILAMPVVDRDTPHKIGCEELRKGWREYVAGTKPKTREDVKSAALDAVGYPAFARIALCDAAEGRYADAAAESTILATGRYSAGPRMAAHWAIFDQAQAIKSSKWRVLTERMVAPTKDDIVRATVVMCNDRIHQVSALTDTTVDVSDKGNFNAMEQAKVAKLTKGKDGMVVSFKSEKWDEPDYKCTNTGRIIQYNAQGAPQYNWHCTQTGSHTETYQLAPRAFSDRTLDGVKPGVILKIITAETAPQIAVPPPSYAVEILEPGKGKQAPKTIRYLGIPLP